MARTVLFLLILCAYVKYSANNELMLPTNLEHVEEVSSFVRYVALNYCFKCHFIAIISDKGVGHYLIKERLLNLCNKALLPAVLTNNISSFVDHTQSEITSKFHMGITPLLVIFVGDLDRNKFMDMIGDVRKLQYLHGTTRILFVFYKPITSTDTTWLEQLFGIVWRSWILRAVAVFWRSSSSDVEIVSFNPFTYDYYVNMTEYAYYEDIFYDKTIDMRGYPLTTMIQAEESEKGKHEGKITDMDTMTLRTAIQHVGATAIIIPSNHWPPRFNTELYMDTIDVFFISSAVVKDNYVESLYPHEQDDICVLVPRGEAIPQVLYLFMVFNIPVWFCFILCVTFGIAGHYFLDRLVKNTDLDVTVMNIIRVILAGPWVHLPQTNAARLLVNFWTLFGLLISSFFICGLTSALIERKYYPDITTLHELEDSGWKIYGSDRDVNLVHDKLQGTFSPEFLARFRPVNKTHINQTLDGNMKKFLRHNLYKAMTSAKKPVLMSKTGASNFLESKESMVDGRRAFSLMHECPVPNQVAYSVTRGRGSVYAAMMDSIVKRLHVSGIIIHWKQVSEIANNAAFDEDKVEEDTDIALLNLYHLQTPFYILAFGMITGFFVFLVEIALGSAKKYRKKRNKKRFDKLNKRKLRKVDYKPNIDPAKERVYDQHSSFLK